MRGLILPNGLGRQSVEITELQAQVLIEIEPILRAMRLHLACPRCLAAGRTQDALVGGNNSPGDNRWSVSCPCTDRAFHRKAS
jgi:hypothetical protein